MTRFLRRLWHIIRGNSGQLDLEDELAFHRQMKEDELRANGIAEPEIAAATDRAMGNALLARERSRDVWVSPWLQDITKDVTFGVRMLVKDRRFTIAAVLALGLGIGVNNSVFTIMNAALFRELPFEQPNRLVAARLIDGRGDGPNGGFQVSYADYLDWRQSATSFEGLIADQSTTMNVSEDGRSAERMRGTYVTANTFKTLHIAPFIGRDFTAEDEQPGAAPVAILSYDIWQSRYSGEPSAIGHIVRINSVPATVIGVMPPGIAYPMMAQLWQPISSTPGISAANRALRNVNVVGRLSPTVEIASARAELETMHARLSQAHPDEHKGLRITVATLKEMHMSGGQAWVVLGTLMGAVTFVLLIACANVASLMLARSAHRAREMAVRAALGASRWRIVRQLLIESVLIAAIAAVAGLGMSRYLASLMATAFNIYDIGAPGGTVRPYWVDISVDTLTLAFVGTICLFVSLAVGLMPSWHLSKTDPNEVLKDGGRGGSTRRARRLTGGLLVGQLALTVILLTGAGLLIRSYFALYLTDLVIDPTGVVTTRMLLPVPKYADAQRQRQFVRTLDERLSALPIFSSVTLGSDIPLHPLGFASRYLAIDGREWPAGESAPDIFYVTVNRRYFETLGLQMLLGRDLTELDGLPGQEGVVVNQRFAARFFGGGDALGKRIRLTGANVKAEMAPWYTIVGVAPSLPNFIAPRAAEPVVYIPSNADPGQQRAVSIIVRTRDPLFGTAATAAALRETVTAIDPDLPVFGIQTLEEAVAVGRHSNAVIGSWFLVIAVSALTLAMIGLYALTAHAVAQRSQEIGVRMALGARAGQVIWLFVRRTVIQLTIGLAIGITGAFGIGQLLSSFLRNTNPRDPLTLAAVTTLLIVVALGASVWPARKAASIDPVEALRAD